MAIYQAAGAGPLAFLNAKNNQYNQIEVPLNFVFFTGNGVDASSWPDYATYQGQVDPLLAMLTSQGYLAASPAALSGAALTGAGLTATATLSGAAGNGITVQIANPSAANGTADITVTLKEVYDNVTPATLATVLGTTAAQAAGLVYDATTPPGSESMPDNFTGPIGAGMNVAVPEPGSAGTAFTLGATLSADTADAEQIQINVVPASGVTPTSFTLTVSWTKAQTGVSLAALTTPATNPFSYLVTFSGSAGPVPAASTVTLGGGGTSGPASVSLLANS